MSLVMSVLFIRVLPGISLVGKQDDGSRTKPIPAGTLAAPLHPYGPLASNLIVLSTTLKLSLRQAARLIHFEQVTTSAYSLHC
jgi:hypothetical protein